MKISANGARLLACRKMSSPQKLVILIGHQFQKSNLVMLI
nr:MAG TPA: hypothetical protein [Caudoviricetes sp.]DAV16434.1 MAG TPA: hypothetical protein [Caudoviricetes sp.]